MSALQWMVVYPQGNRNILTISRVLEWEQDEYSLASLKRFDEEKEAAIYARRLASEYSIALANDSSSKLLHVLDLDD